MKTVKVRIAVAVDPKGDWNSCGWKDGSDQDKMDNAIEVVGEGEAQYWLEAELPIPEAQVIQAEVKEVGA